MFDSIIRLFTTVAPDFQILYQGARDFAILDGNTNQPTTLLFYRFLTYFDYLVAQNIFTILSFFAMCFSVYMVFKILNLRLNIFLYLIIFLLLFLSFPSKFTFGMGQSNFITLFLLLISYFFSFNKKPVLTGLVLGILISYKLVFVYFLIYFLLTKNLKTIFTALTVYLLFNLAIIFTTNSIDLFAVYYKEILPPLTNFIGREVAYNQGLSGFISRVFTDIDLRVFLTAIISVVLIGINIFASKLLKQKHFLFVLTTLTFLLIDTYSWQHHFVLLLFSFVLLWLNTKDLLIKLLLVMSYIFISFDVPTQFYGLMILYLIVLKEVLWSKLTKVYI